MRRKRAFARPRCITFIVHPGYIGLFGDSMASLALKLDGFGMPDALRRHWRAWAVLGAMAALWLAAAISVGIESVSPRPELDRSPPAPQELVRLRAEAEAT